MADHVLVHGMFGSGLRALAAAAGTSDRMLIYHFATKTALMVAILREVARSLEARLDAALPPVRSEDARGLQGLIVAAMRAQENRSYVKLWFEIIAAAARGDPAATVAARAIADIFLAWIEVRRPLDGAAAAELFALVEGALLLDEAGVRGCGDALVAYASG